MSPKANQIVPKDQNFDKNIILEQLKLIFLEKMMFTFAPFNTRFNGSMILWRDPYRPTAEIRVKFASINLQSSNTAIMKSSDGESHLLQCCEEDFAVLITFLIYRGTFFELNVI